tara:strand:+ start:290 stop:688 length:399 start_codon:yes stop_codon:yes gene_type:complete
MSDRSNKIDPIMIYGQFLLILDEIELFTFACRTCHSARINNPSGKLYPNCSRCRVHNLRAGLPPLKKFYDEYGRPSDLHKQFDLKLVMKIIAKRFEQICASYDSDIQDTTSTILGRFVKNNRLPLPRPSDPK